MAQVNHLLSKFGKLSPLAPILLRVTLGVLLILNGIDKFTGGISNVQDFFAAEGVPFATFTAPLAAVLEIAIGGALVAGLFTRLSAIIMTGFFAVAIVTVKAADGILGSADIDILYTAGLVSLLILGPGKFAVDNLIAKGIEVEAANRALEKQLAAELESDADLVFDADAETELDGELVFGPHLLVDLDSEVDIDLNNEFDGEFDLDNEFDSDFETDIDPDIDPPPPPFTNLPEPSIA